MTNDVLFPIPVEIAKSVGAGAYTDIVSITAPSSAVAGSRVDITVKIKNTYSSIMTMVVGGALEYGVVPWPTISFPNDKANVAAGATHSFSGYFTMPSKDVTIHAYSYYYGSDGSYHFDDEMTKDVDLNTKVWIPLASASLIVKKAAVSGGWVPLASASLVVKKAAVGGWVPLASASLVVKKAIVGGWVPLASSTLVVMMAMTGGWVPLATASMLVQAGASAGEDVFRGDLVVEFSKH